MKNVDGETTKRNAKNHKGFTHIIFTKRLNNERSTGTFRTRILKNWTEEVCSNCGTEFESEDVHDLTSFPENFNDELELVAYGFHECVGGMIGVKVFKCLMEVNE